MAGTAHNQIAKLTMPTLLPVNWGFRVLGGWGLGCWVSNHLAGGGGVASSGGSGGGSGGGGGILLLAVKHTRD